MYKNTIFTLVTSLTPIYNLQSRQIVSRQSRFSISSPTAVTTRNYTALKLKSKSNEIFFMLRK